MIMGINLVSLPAALGGLILKFLVAKYIEAAGTEAGAMTSRAVAIKTIASELDSVALGTMSLSQLATATSAELATSKISVSNQILVNGLVTLLGTVAPTGGLLAAAQGAMANVFLQDVIAVATQYGA